MVGIYKIENKVNGKIYVGQSSIIETRWYNHVRELNKNIHTNKYLQSAWNKYGEKNFEFKILEECSIDSLDEREIFWIERLNSYYKINGYNLTTGGKGTRLFTNDDVQLIWEIYNSGKHIPREIAEEFNVSEKTIRRYLYYGTNLGKCYYDREDSSFEAHAVKVICLNNFEIFESVDSAENKYNINGVTACCKHKIKYAGKNENNEYLLWMYLDEYELYSKEEIEEYKNDLLLKIHEKDVVCLNTREIFDTSMLASKWCNLNQIQTIQFCCNRKLRKAGRHPVTGENLAWAYYIDYIKMSENEIIELIKKANTSPCTKEVICLNNLNVFDTPIIASKWCGETSEKIKKCCRDEANNAGHDPDTNELLTWMYLENYENASEEYIKNKLYIKEYTYTNPDRMRSLICLNDLSIFKSMKEAGSWCGLRNPSGIGEHLHGKRKTAGKHPITGEKLKWMYYEDYLKLNNINNSEEKVS